MIQIVIPSMIKNFFKEYFNKIDKDTNKFEDKIILDLFKNKNNNPNHIIEFDDNLPNDILFKLICKINKNIKKMWNDGFLIFSNSIKNDENYFFLILKDDLKYLIYFSGKNYKLGELIDEFYDNFDEIIENNYPYLKFNKKIICENNIEIDFNELIEKDEKNEKIKILN